MPHKNKAILFIISLLLIYSCKRIENTEKDIQDIRIQVSDTIGAHGTISQSGPIYLLPTPGEVLEYINNYKIIYNPDLLNPPENYKKYITDKPAAINLGIYISDLAYTSIFKKNNESLQYLESIEILMDQLKLSGAVNQTLVQKIKNRYNVLDSLTEISNEVFDEVIEYLKTRQMYNTLSLISIGGYLEGLEITINTIYKHEPNNELLIYLIDQKYIFNNLYAMVMPHLKGSLYQKERAYLNNLKSIFENIQEEYETVKIDDNKSNHFDLKNKSVLHINQEDFMALKKEVNLIRDEIIKNEASNAQETIN